MTSRQRDRGSADQVQPLDQMGRELELCSGQILSQGADEWFGRAKLTRGRRLATERTITS